MTMQTLVLEVRCNDGAKNLALPFGGQDLGPTLTYLNQIINDGWRVTQAQVIEAEVIGTKRIFMALPSTGTLVSAALDGLSTPASVSCQIINSMHSALAHNFNHLWCCALNSRKQARWTHWAMHHSDVVAPARWVDGLIKEQEDTGADVVSAIIAIKNSKGWTSTGMHYPDLNYVRRLTVREAMSLPKTFGEEELREFWDCPNGTLVMNTGLWVCDFTKDWVENVYFNQPSKIIKLKTKDGGNVFRAWFLPEDWRVSRYFKKIGLKVKVTRKVLVDHEGTARYGLGEPWGEATDSEFVEKFAQHAEVTPTAGM
jgi:hypothetical protein